MGLLFYGGMAQAIAVPDELLAHAKVVIATKLRRGESFTLSWRHAEGEQPGRSTIWLEPSIPLRFVFSTTESPTIDPDLLRSLATEANSTAGLLLDLSLLDRRFAGDLTEELTLTG